MSKAKTVIEVITSLVSIFLLLPMSFYITYWILVQLNPDRLVWFLFIGYVPLTIFMYILSGVAKAFLEDE